MSNKRNLSILMRFQEKKNLQSQNISKKLEIKVSSLMQTSQHSVKKIKNQMKMILRWSKNEISIFFLFQFISY